MIDKSKPSMKLARLIQLSKKADSLIQFDFMGQAKRFGPALGKSALKWGGIGAAGGAVAGGVGGALSDDPNHTAIGGALSGALAGGALGAAGGAGMRGMRMNSAINKAAGLKTARLATNAVLPVREAGSFRGNVPAANTSVADALAAKEEEINKAKRIAATHGVQGQHDQNRSLTSSMLSSRHTRLVQLSKKAGKLIEFRSSRDDDSHILRNTAAAVGTAGAGVGAYYGDKALMNKYGQRKMLGMGDNIPGFVTTPPSTPAGGAKDFASITPGTQTPATFEHITQPGATSIGRGQAYSAAARDAGQTVSNRFNRASTGMSHAYETALRHPGTGRMKAGWLALKKGAKMFSTRHEKLVQLSKSLDGLIQLGSAPTKRLKLSANG